MLELQGKYNMAKVFTNNIETEAVSQIINFLNYDISEGSTIRIMPDVHAGKGCTIGFTMSIKDKICPNLVGVDIGCGVFSVCLDQRKIDLETLDSIIRNEVPSGKNIHKERKANVRIINDLTCFRELKSVGYVEKSVGSLGGGNHYIEVDIDEAGNYYLVVHSGSRHLGKEVAEYHQKMALELMQGKGTFFEQKELLIKEYKEQGRKAEIQKALKQLEKQYMKTEVNYHKDLCFLTGQYKDAYLNDMKICQEYAKINRETIARIILKHLFNGELESFKTINTTHNYINFDDNILRKGAVSAHKDEVLLIPINMRDGALLCIGKGNKDWNFSAPHGAGRLMSRTKARETLSLENYQKEMDGIYTTSVNMKTLDEAPMAYKPIEEIIENIKDTVEIVDIIKPIYNFKASD